MTTSVRFESDAAAPFAIAKSAEEQQAFAFEIKGVLLDQKLHAFICHDTGAIGARVGQQNAIRLSFNTAMLAGDMNIH
jgi:hypothetical protein